MQDSGSSKTDILDWPPAEFSAWLTAKGHAPYRARQVLRWIYSRQADEFDAMTDVAKGLRRLLADRFVIGRLSLGDTAESADGAVKYLFRLPDAQSVETVLIPEKNHFTLCISSQVGCAQGCKFCQTGRHGLVRNLSRGEMISQVRDTARLLKDPARLTNIVVMGMGEPLANYDNVVGAVNTMVAADSGLGFSSRRITISTAGLAPKIAALGHDTPANLAVSLNAADDQTRDRLMPINRKYPIARLLEACRQYPLAPRRRITFEYILIKDVNDSPEAARRLAKLLRPLRAKVNLIPYNPHPGSDFKRPDASVVREFQNVLLSSNYTVIIRKSKGADIMAACGQLRARAHTEGIK